MGKNLKGKEIGKGFRQRPDGRYEVRFTVGGESRSLYNNSLTELRKQHKQELAKAGKEVKVSCNSVCETQEDAYSTVSAWFDRWFSVYKFRTLKESSAITMSQAFNNVFRERIGERRLSSITNIDVQIAVNCSIDSGMSVKTAKNAFSCLKDSLDVAIGAGIITRNPCIGVVFPKTQSNQAAKAPRFLTEKEQTDFLLAAEDSWYKEMFYIMFLTGMRAGEIGGLTWDDVDFYHSCFNVNHTLMCVYMNGAKIQKLTAPKTVSSYRMIPFMGEALQMMLAQKKKQEAITQKLGTEDRGGLGKLVFTTTRGTPCSRAVIEREVKLIVKKINDEATDGSVFERMHPHTIRHTFCSQCFRKGIAPKIVQQYMGHSSIDMTMNIYTHVTENDMYSAAEKFGNAL